MLKIALLTVALAFLADAQSTPNFTGTWIQDNSKSSERKNLTFRYSNEVVHRGQDLTVITIAAEVGRPVSTSTQHFIVDGKPHQIRVRDEVSVNVVVNWEGHELVFSTELGSN